MTFPGLLAFGVSLGALLGGVSACSGPEAGSIIYSERSSPGTADPDDDDTTKSTTGATVPAKDEMNVVFGTSAFTAGTPVNGPAKGKTAHTMNAQNDPSGIDCMGCHAATFAFGGTVYSSAAGAAPVAGAEIRVTGPDGTTIASAFSDADGNFWIASAQKTIPPKSRVGVRNGTKEKIMTSPVAGADGAKCNNATGCHGSPTLRIFLD